MKKYIFSHSQLQAADCSNKYHIRYVYKLQSKRYSKKKALSIGKLFHAGIEVMYRVANMPVSMDESIGDLPLAKALSHVRALAKQMQAHLERDEDESLEAFEKKLAIDFGIPLIMLEYYYKIMFLHEKFETIAPEEKIMVNVRTPSGRRSPNMFYLGYMDSIIRNLSADSGKYLHEVKTAQNWGPKDEDFLKIDPQTTGYHWMAKEKNIPLDGTMYTICLKPGIKPNLLEESKKKKREAKKDNKIYTYEFVKDYESVESYLARVKEDYENNPQKYFIRRVFTRSPEQLERFEKELYFKCQDAKRIREGDNFMQPNKMNCPMCDGYDLCKDWSKETMERWYEAKKRDDSIDIKSITIN